MESVQTIGDIVVRSLVVYLFIVLAIRLFGKKELAQLSTIDLVFILLISNSVQNAMVGPSTSLLGGLTAAAVLFATNAVLKHFIYRNKQFSRFLQGQPVMLIHKGHLMTENLLREGISLDEIHAAIREHGVSEIGDIDLAVLEVDGNISILSRNYTHHTRKFHRKANQHKSSNQV